MVDFNSTLVVQARAASSPEEERRTMRDPDCRGTNALRLEFTSEHVFLKKWG